MIEETFEAELCPVPGRVTGDLRLECDTREGVGRVGARGWRHTMGLAWQKETSLY